ALGGEAKARGAVRRRAPRARRAVALPPRRIAEAHGGGAERPLGPLTPDPLFPIRDACYCHQCSRSRSHRCGEQVSRAQAPLRTPAVRLGSPGSCTRTTPAPARERTTTISRSLCAWGLRSNAPGAVTQSWST